jgi:hypothetical protein
LLKEVTSKYHCDPKEDDMTGARKLFWLVVYVAIGVALGGVVGVAFCLVALGELDGLLLSAAITVGVVKGILHWAADQWFKTGAFEKKK